jgi:hypothetical protein
VSRPMRNWSRCARWTTTPPVSTFVVRFWQEWSSAGPRWRSRIEHVQSGKNAASLGSDEMLDSVRSLAWYGLLLYNQAWVHLPNCEHGCSNLCRHRNGSAIKMIKHHDWILDKSLFSWEHVGQGWARITHRDGLAEVSTKQFPSRLPTVTLDQAARQGHKCNEVDEEAQLSLAAAIVCGVDDRNLAGVEVYWIDQGHSHNGMVIEILDDPLVRFLPHPLDDGGQEDAKVRVDLRATSAGCRQEASPSKTA